jgi:uroporphyrin-3 C-methyltransferase
VTGTSQKDAIQSMTTDDQTQKKSTKESTNGLRLQNIGRWGARFILLLFLAGSGFLHYQSYHQGLRQQELLVVTKAHLATNQQQCQQYAQQSAHQQQRLRSLLDQQTERLVQAQQNGIQQAQQLSQLRQQLLGLSASSRTDWQLLELESLLKAAGHQLWLLHDVGAARRLLQGAADRLTLLNNPSLLPLRQALAEDSRQLAAIDLPDQEALVLQLLNELGEIDRLPLAQPRTQVADDEVALPPTPLVETMGWFQRLLHQGSQMMRRLITIQRQTGKDVTLAAPSEGVAREKLSAYLRLAVQAVLQWQLLPYQHYLGCGISLLQAQFDPQDPEVLALLARLRQRQQQTLLFELPHQLRSQILLEAFLQRWLGESRLLSPQSGTVH